MGEIRDQESPARQYPFCSRFVMITGVASGIGKSTLAAGLAERVGGSGDNVELFREEDVFRDSAFSVVARRIRRPPYPTDRALEAAYRRLVRRVGTDRTLLFDWDCLRMAGMLPWGSDPVRLCHHSRAVLTESQALRPIVLNLTGSVLAAVRRAAATRSAEWLRRYEQRAASEETLLAKNIEIYRETGWPVRDVDGSQPPAAVVEASLAILTRRRST